MRITFVVWLVAARIWLKVVNVKVERLEEISKEDALAEGVETWLEGSCKTRRYRDYISGGSFGDDYAHTLGGVHPAIESFRSLWGKINRFKV